MRILWLGDAVVSSGFARATHKVCDYLHAQGHEIHVLGINYWGDTHPYPYPIYPCYNPLQACTDLFGVHRLPMLIAQLQPDAVVILQDPWNIPAYFEQIDRCQEETIRISRERGIDPPVIPSPPIIGWLAVDSKNHNGKPLNRLSHIVTWTQFGEDELIAGGYQGPTSIVPLGVDTTLYRPLNQLESRRQIFSSLPHLHENAFIVGVVGRNQPRKRLDLTLEYFAAWVRTYGIEDGYLYLHVAPTGDRGVDIPSLVRYYGLQNRVIINSPDIGFGEPETLMPLIYSTMDVYLTTTQGEGFGLPCLEAMACGTPCIVPNWSGLGDQGWTGDAAIKIPCTSTAITALNHGLACTIGGIPDKQGVIEALQRCYEVTAYGYGRNETVSNGLDLARILTWDSVGKGMLDVIESVVARQE